MIRRKDEETKMGVVCEYCGREYSHRRVHCPRCGTPNWEIDPKVPASMKELKELCKKRNIDLKTLHFHLDEDYEGAKAYGEYRNDAGEFVCYKNHHDGKRDVFYQGTDEREAAKALYARLCRSLHATHGVSPQSHGAKRSFDREKKRQRRSMTEKLLTYVGIGLVVLAILLALYFAMSSSSTLLSNEKVVEMVETVTSGS